MTFVSDCLGIDMKLVVKAIVLVVVAQSSKNSGEDIYWCQVQFINDPILAVEAEIGHLSHIKTVYIIMISDVEISVTLPDLDHYSCEQIIIDLVTALLHLIETLIK